MHSVQPTAITRPAYVNLNLNLIRLGALAYTRAAASSAAPQQPGNPLLYLLKQPHNGVGLPCWPTGPLPGPMLPSLGSPHQCHMPSHATVLFH
jgi:hypothetical protein